MGFNPKGDPETVSGREIALTTAYSFRGYLERYFDSGLAVPEAISRESLVSSEIERIKSAATIIYVVSTIPRRLGGEATDAELALDKKRAKRVGWALEQALGGWTRKRVSYQVTAEIQREGAQLEWELFVPAHLTQLNTELCLVATWAIQNDEARWGRSAVVSLENEIRWMTYAMRD